MTRTRIVDTVCILLITASIAMLFVNWWQFEVAWEVVLQFEHQVRVNRLIDFPRAVEWGISNASHSHDISKFSWPELLGTVTLVGAAVALGLTRFRTKTPSNPATGNET